MRVLVTGGAGFIGSHLVECLLQSGHHVFVLDDLSTGSESNLSAVRDDVDLRRGDVADPAALRSVMRDGGVELVFHLAAAVGVRHIAADPGRALRTNVSGSEAVLDACVRAGVPVVLASSSEVYGERALLPFAEHEELVVGRPDALRSGYTGAKALMECAAFARAQRHGLRVLTLRFFNTVGQRQRARFGMVLPRFLASAIAGRPIVVHGDGLQTRSFADVRDVAAATAALAQRAWESGTWGETFNVGGAQELSILDLAGRVCEAAGADPQLIEHRDFDVDLPSFGAGVRRRVPDLRRLRAALGWVPARPIEETMDWLLGAPQPARAPGCRGTLLSQARP